MFTLEITAAIDSSGTLRTFYLSTEGFQTVSTDTPSLTNFIDKIDSPGSIGIHAFADGKTGGFTKLEKGEIIIPNNDGEYDSWKSYSFDGRPVVIRYGVNGGAYPSSFSTVLTATIEDIEMDWGTITLRLRDKQYVFDKPLQTNKYGGTNVLPNGVDGTSNDIKGQVKPKLYGKAYQLPVPCVNTSKLVYQAHDGILSSIDNVYDGGLLLTNAGNDPDVTTLLAATIAAGQYRTCTSTGVFRLGSTPAQQITCDATQGASAAVRTAAQILKQMALDAGLSSGEISATDVTNMDAANSAVLGIWISDDTTFLNAMDQIAGSVGAFYGFDSTGTLRMSILTAPTGTPVKTFYLYDYEDGIERNPPKDNNLPVWSTKVNHSKIYSVQTTGLNGSATAAMRAYLAQEYRSEVNEVASVKTQYLLAETIGRNTLFTSAADAAIEAARLETLYQVRRDFFSVPIEVDDYVKYSLKLMDLVGVVTGRFNMDARHFRILGLDLDFSTKTVTMQIWG